MMKRNRVLYLILIFTILPGFWGCVNLQKTYPDKQYYMIEVDRKPADSDPLSDRILEIRKFKASPQYRGKEMVYQTGEFRYKSDFYNNYFVPPEAMMLVASKKWLQGSGLFKEIVESYNRLDPCCYLEGYISKLHGDYRDPASPKAVIEIDFLFFQEYQNQLIAMFHKSYHREIPMAYQNAEDLAGGLNQGLREIFSDLEEDLKKVELNQGDGDEK